MRPYAADAAKLSWLQSHNARPSGMTRELVESMAAYAKAPLAERCCISAITLRTNPAELEDFRHAFAAVDFDRDGKISHKELANSLNRPEDWWMPRVNPDELF